MAYQNAFILPPPNEPGARQFLETNKWPRGLQEKLIDGMKRFPIRFVIVDNSGSMSTGDGFNYAVVGNTRRAIQCSRWTELTSSLRFHAALAEAAQAPTEFRLLNDANPVVLGLGDDNGQKYYNLMNHFDQSPNGGTPLCYHITQIIQEVQSLKPQLIANNQKAAIIIATDGEPSDGNLATAMAPLRNLPVWVILRLCTSEENVLKYWEDIDKQLELNMDVLDDITSEAKEVNKVNPWLVYGEPLHRLREFGVSLRELDMIDEKLLTADEMRAVISAITVGGPSSEVPHPSLDWAAFDRFVRTTSTTIGQVWDPISGRQSTWVRPQLLAKHYKPSSGCIIL